MKTKTFVTACFAGVGIFLMVTGSMAVVASFYMLTEIFSDPVNRYMGIAQFLVLAMPFASGCLFFAFAPQFSSLVCLRSKITAEDGAVPLQPVHAITVACVLSGLIIGLAQIPEFAQDMAKQFLLQASPAYAMNHQGEDYRVMMIRPGIYSLAAAIFLWKAKAFADWLVSKYERP